MAHITDILTREEAQSLQEEFNELLCDGTSYEEVEELMLDYGLEMDYLFDLIY